MIYAGQFIQDILGGGAGHRLLHVSMQRASTTPPTPDLDAVHVMVSNSWEKIHTLLHVMLSGEFATCGVIVFMCHECFKSKAISLTFQHNSQNADPHKRSFLEFVTIVDAFPEPLRGELEGDVARIGAKSRKKVTPLARKLIGPLGKLRESCLRARIHSPDVKLYADDMDSVVRAVSALVHRADIIEGEISLPQFASITTFIRCNGNMSQRFIVSYMPCDE